MFRRARPSTHAESRREPLDLNQLRRLLAFVRPYRVQLAFGIVSVAISSALSLIFPQFVGRFADSFATGRGLAQLDRVVLLLLAVFVVQAVFNFLRTYLLSLVGEGVVADMRTTLYAHLVTLPVRFFEGRKTGEITSRLTSDVAVVQGAVSQALAQLVNQVVLLLGSVVLLFVTNLPLTLLMLAVVPVVVLAAAFFGRKLRRISTLFQDQVADANASAEEAIVGIRVVQSFTAERLETERYRGLVKDSYRTALRRAVFRAVFSSCIILAMFAAISVVLWVGGRLVVTGALSAGELVTFLLYTLFVAGAVGALTGLYSQFQEALGASARIFDLLDEKNTLTSGRLQDTRVQGSVRFERVAFRYGDRGDEDVLEDISLEAQPGQVLALVGPSGAGKSTLVSLIPRFYDPSAGRILVDGKDLRDYDLHSLRETIGIVPQETQLFSGTIRENIRYGREGASDNQRKSLRDDEVVAVAQAANAHDFIGTFPDGYDTIVGERGVKLSGGQRQRVAIARALLKNPRILILDEATSSLDSESEALVQEALETLMRGRTTFVIAHRLSTIHNADKIVVLERGRIAETGDHDALLARGGLYHALYTRQFRPDGVVAQT